MSPPNRGASPAGWRLLVPMKTIRRLLLLLPGLASLALAADNLPVFRGIIAAARIRNSASPAPSAAGLRG